MRTRLVVSGAPALAALVAIAGCSRSPAQQTRNPSPTDVVASVGSTSVTLAEVDRTALQVPAANFGNLKLSQALYEARRAALDAIVDDLLLDQEAKARSLATAALVEQEINAKAPPLGEAEITAWYKTNQGRLQGAPLDQLRPQIQTFLMQERTRAARRQYLDQLRGKATVRMLLDPPRQTVAAAKYVESSKGPANAPIELIEFSDFECPFCLRAYPTVKQVLETYGDKIRFVHRHYPLSIHPHARPAAEASQCAAEQGQFWAYHDLLFADPSRLTDPDLKAGAAKLGLNAAQFNACLDSHKYKSDVETDVAAGDEVGVSGTPMFFINGRLLDGAQPIEAFKRIIDEELALKK
ncbi:MAG: thioredoxin domain-containing protein [Vicinamibacterales bacterium]